MFKIRSKNSTDTKRKQSLSFNKQDRSRSTCSRFQKGTKLTVSGSFHKMNRIVKPKPKLQLFNKSKNPSQLQCQNELISVSIQRLTKQNGEIRKKLNKEYKFQALLIKKGLNTLVETMSNQQLREIASIGKYYSLTQKLQFLETEQQNLHKGIQKPNLLNGIIDKIIVPLSKIEIVCRQCGVKRVRKPGQLQTLIRTNSQSMVQMRQGLSKQQLLKERATAQLKDVEATCRKVNELIREEEISQRQGKEQVKNAYTRSNGANQLLIEIMSIKQNMGCLNSSMRILMDEKIKRKVQLLRDIGQLEDNIFVGKILVKPKEKFSKIMWSSKDIQGN